MLWRLGLRGVDVGLRWRELADAWQALIEIMQGAAARSGTNAMMTRDVGLPVAHALVAFVREDYDRAVAARFQ